MKVSPRGDRRLVLQHSRVDWTKIFAAKPGCWDSRYGERQDHPVLYGDGLFSHHFQRFFLRKSDVSSRGFQHKTPNFNWLQMNLMRWQDESIRNLNRRLIECHWGGSPVMYHPAQLVWNHWRSGLDLGCAGKASVSHYVPLYCKPRSQRKFHLLFEWDVHLRNGTKRFSHVRFLTVVISES